MRPCLPRNCPRPPLGLDRRFAATPSLTAVRPVGGQRGTELDVTLSGARLGDAQEISTTSRGSRRSPSRRSTTTPSRPSSRSRPIARLGLHDLRVRTATGISELRTFTVGALKEIDRGRAQQRLRQAPADRDERRRSTAWPTTRTSITSSSRPRKGERISAEVEGHRLGIFEFDPTWRSSNAKRFELGVERRRGAGLARRVHLDRRPRGRQVHHPGPRERLLGQRRVPLPAPRRQLPPGDGRDARRRQARRDAGRALDRRRGRRDHDQGHAAGLGLRASSAWSRRTTRGSPPTPTASGSRPLGNVIEAEPNDDQAHATPFTAPMAAQRRDRQAGRRRPLRLQGDQGPGLRHPLLRPPHPLAARPGDVPGQEGRRGDAGRRRRASARTATSGSRPPRPPSTSSGWSTSSARAGRTTPTGSRSRRSRPR